MTDDRSILDQISESYFEVDLKGNYTFVNEPFCRRTGIARDQIIGRNFRDFTGITSPEAVPRLKQVFQDVYRTGQPVRAFEFQTRSTADGTAVFVEISVSLRRNAAGEPIGFASVSRDITERKRYEHELAQAKQEAEAANRAKGEFLANMSHEIRTPMNGLLGMTELLLETDLTPYQAEGLAIVKASAESLLRILNDVLDFSKIESRKLEFESRPFAIAEVVRRVIRPLALSADEKGLELIVDIAPDVSPGFVGDAGRLVQILTNLVGNAIKFTPSGHVVLNVQQRRTESNDVEVRFAVSDTGIGIPADKQQAIFEAFCQAEASTTRRFGGTGLGLTISSTLVHLMGGRIWVESEPGVGSTFHVAMALAPADPPDLLVDDKGLADVRVLVVDDNPINRRIFVELLDRWGLKATPVDGGQAALAALTAATAAGTPFELVLLDANMPDLDGFSVAERIGAEPALATATIMMLTSAGHYGDAARCDRLGISAYLTKPVEGSELLQAIKQALQRRHKARPAERKTPPAAIGRAAVSRRVLLAEDNAVNQRVALAMLRKRGHDVTLVESGRAAIDAVAGAQFDVVLMDVQMPEVDGFEATAAIRAAERAGRSRVRIVAMTAHAMHGDRERCLAAGMDSYLAKPLNVAALFAAVEETPTC